MAKREDWEEPMEIDETPHPMYHELRQVEMERWSQIAKWGEQRHTPAWWLVILTEELGEVARAIFEGDDGDYYDELKQVAAVAVAAMESYTVRGAPIPDPAGGYA